MDTKWKADWIWCSGSSRPGNFYLYARKAFSLNRKPRTAPCRVTADSRYILFVNGQRVGRGPARCHPSQQIFETYDLAPHLRKGENVLAALVHHYGAWTFQYLLGRGGFLLECSFKAGGQTRTIKTDRTWKVLPAKAWKRDLRRISVQLGYPEVYDARLEPIGWKEPGFDDSAWRTPRVIGKAGIKPWTGFLPRPIPHLPEEPTLSPAKLLASGGTSTPRRLQYIDFRRKVGYYRTRMEGVYFARTYVHTSRGQRVTFGFSSQSAIRVWLNTRDLGTVATSQNEVPIRREMDLRLRGGWNLLFVKVPAGCNEWELFVEPRGMEAGDLVFASSPGADDGAWEVAGPFSSPDGDILGTVFYPEIHQRAREAMHRSGNQEIGWERIIPTSGEDQVGAWLRLEAFDDDSPVVIEGEGNLVRPEGTTKVTTNGGNAAFILDFGREIVGYPRLVIDSSNGGEVIDIGYDEVVDEEGRPNPYRNNLNYADRYITRPGEQVFETFDKRAFRYMHLTVRGGELDIKRIACDFSTYPVKEGGSFESSDQFLNKLWKVGAYTVQLNMEDAYTDCPWRERAQWWGDARVEALCNYYAFGDYALMAKCLRLQALSVEEEKHGLIWGMYPGGWPMLLPDFNLVYIISLWDYYLFSGDLEAVRTVYPSVIKSLRFFEKHTARDSLLSNVPEWVFIDWAEIDKRGKATSLNLFYVAALDALAILAAALGKTQDVDKYAARANQVRTAINEKFYDKRRGIYVDCIPRKGKCETVSQHANCLAILFNVAPPDTWDRILDSVMGPKRKVVQAGTPYFSFYVLGALYRAGRHAEAAAYMRRWKTMLDAGATTWWEHWEPKHSHCHGWSAAPTYYLSREFLGVKPKRPGWATVEIAPVPGKLKHAEGQVPTPHGEIKVAWKRSKDRLRLEVEVPRACATSIRVPLGKRGRILINGKKSEPRSLTRLEDSDGCAVFSSRRGGQWVFEAS